MIARDNLGQMIAARVRAVPADLNIVKPGREFVLDDGAFREKGRAGYRCVCWGGWVGSGHVHAMLQCACACACVCVCVCACVRAHACVCVHALGD